MKLACVALAVHVLAAPATAHHNFASEFDAKRPLKLTGTVTKIKWTNPHAWFYIDVKDDNAAVKNWAMEMGSPNNLMRAGWKRDSMKIGDVVSVEGFHARDRDQLGNARVVVLTRTGQRLFAASSVGR